MSYLHPDALAHGFEKAVLIAGSWCMVGGLTAAIGIRNPTRKAPGKEPDGEGTLTYCALEATPLRRGGQTPAPNAS